MARVFGHSLRQNLYIRVQLGHLGTEPLRMGTRIILKG